MGGKSSTSTQQITIPPEVLARYNSVNATAERAAAKPFQAYSGEFVAPVNQQQQQGIAGINAAANQAQPTYQQAIAGTQGAYYGAQPYNQAATGYALGAGQNVNASDLNGAAINKYMSPYLSNVVGSEAALLNQNNQQAMAGQLGNAITSGAFGGDRAGIAAANLAQQQQLANANIYSNLLNQGYGQALSTAQQQQGVNLGAQQANRAAYGNAAQLLQGIGQQQFGQGLGAAQQTAALGQGAQEAALQGAQAQVGAGTLQQQTAQAADTANYNQFLQQQSYPFQTAQFLANIAEGTGALSGSTTTATQPGGFFSDERLKENIEPIGKTFDGQTIHKYNYKGDPRTQIGLIAQEVERHHPEAVGLAGGYKTVDYDKATSEGGAVGLGHAGEGFAYGGTPMLPGVSPVDMSAILQSQQQMYSPYSGSGLYGGKPGGGMYGGGGGHVPAANLPVAHLATANMGMPQQKTALQTMKDAADAAKGMQNTWKDAKGAYKDIKDAYNSHKVGQDINNFHGDIGNIGDGSTAAGAANVVDANTPPEPSLKSASSDSSAEARGGLAGHPLWDHLRSTAYADGGEVLSKLDIPEISPHAQLAVAHQNQNQQQDNTFGNLTNLLSSLKKLSGGGGDKNGKSKNNSGDSSSGTAYPSTPTLSDVPTTTAGASETGVKPPSHGVVVTVSDPSPATNVGGIPDGVPVTNGNDPFGSTPSGSVTVSDPSPATNVDGIPDGVPVTNGNDPFGSTPSGSVDVTSPDPVDPSNTNQNQNIPPGAEVDANGNVYVYFPGGIDGNYSGWDPNLDYSRGGLAGHLRRRADGGAMPYASSGGGLDIPEVVPQAHSLQTAGSMGGPGQSGLGQIKQAADTANSVMNAFGFADGGLVPSSIDIPEEKPSQQLAVASAPTPQKDQTMQTIMDVAKIAAMFAARGGAVHREGHAYGGMPGANPALEGINHPSMAVTPSTGGAKGMMHQPMHPALAHALENMRHADGGRIHKAFAGSVAGLDPQDFSSSSNASGSFDTPEPSWWEKNVTGIPGQRSGFGQLIDKMNQQSADQVALENERKVREARRNALASQTGFFSPGTPEELAIKRHLLDEANANLEDLQKPGALQRIRQQSADRVPPLVPQQPTALSPQPAAPAAAANKPASRVAPAAPAESPAAPPTADAGLAAAKPSYEPPTNAVPEGAGISPPSTQSLLDKALANPRDQGLAAAQSAAQPTTPATEQEHKQNLLAKALGLFKTNGEYDSGKVIPFFTGLAAMGLAPTRSLGVALSAGVGAGAQSYLPTQQQKADIAQTQAQTGNIKASANLTNATTLQELTAGKPNGTVVVEDPKGKFVTQDGKHYSIVPAAATFMKTNQPDLSSVKYNYLGRSGMDAAKSAVREYDFTSNPLMKDTSTKIYNETMADAEQARSELTKNRLWLQSVASLEPGSLTEPGALNGFLSGIVAKANAVLGKLDPSLVIDPKGLTDQQIAQKLSTNSAALTEAGLGQRSVAALQTLSKATANPEMTRNAALTLIADQIAGSERRIDQGNYLNEYEQEAKRNSSYEGTGAGHFLANRAIRAFGADRPASSYESDREAILELARDKPKQLAQMYEIMRSGSPEDKEYLRQKLEIKYGKNFARYITGE